MTSATTPKTVDLGDACRHIRREAVAGGAITPGMLMRGPDSAGEVLVHNQADNIAEGMFALEFDKTGRTIADAYAADDQVEYGVFPQGARVYAWLQSGQNITKGALLTSSGDGRLKVAGNTSFVVARALESVDASGAAARIRVEVMLGKAAASAN